MLKIDQIIFDDGEDPFKCIFWAETNGDYLTLCNVAEALLAYAISEFDLKVSYAQLREQIIDDIIYQGIGDIGRINEQFFLEYEKDSSLFCVSPNKVITTHGLDIIHHIRRTNVLTTEDAEPLVKFFKSETFKRYSSLLHELFALDRWEEIKIHDKIMQDITRPLYLASINNLSEDTISLIFDEKIPLITAEIEKQRSMRNK